MANTYTLISTYTVSSPVDIITFSSIPSTFTDLVIVLNARTTFTGSGYGEQINFKFNGLTTNFSSQRIEWFSSTIAGSTETDSRFAKVANANEATGVFATTNAYIFNYAGSQTNKNWISYTAKFDTTSATYNDAFLYGGMWANSSAINSISLDTAEATNFVQYSMASLYGIKNS